MLRRKKIGIEIRFLVRDVEGVASSGVRATLGLISVSRVFDMPNTASARDGSGRLEEGGSVYEDAKNCATCLTSADASLSCPHDRTSTSVRRAEHSPEIVLLRARAAVSTGVLTWGMSDAGQHAARWLSVQHAEYEHRHALVSGHRFGLPAVDRNFRGAT
jgi:hypothetical protein